MGALLRQLGSNGYGVRGLRPGRGRMLSVPALSILAFCFFGCLLPALLVAQASEAQSEAPVQCHSADWKALSAVGKHAPVLTMLKEQLGSGRVTASTLGSFPPDVANGSTHDVSPAGAGLVLGTNHGRVITWGQEHALCTWQLPSSGGRGPSPVQALLPLQDGSLLVAAGLELYRVPSRQDQPIQTIRLGLAAQADGSMLDAVPPAYFTAMLQRSNGQILLGSAGGVWSMSPPGPEAVAGPELCDAIPATRVRALVQPSARHVVVGSRTRGLLWLELSDGADCSALKPLATPDRPLRKDVTTLAVLPPAGEGEAQVGYGTFDGEVGIAAQPDAALVVLRSPRQSASPAIVHRMVAAVSSKRLLVAIGQELYALERQAEVSSDDEPLIPRAQGHDPRQVGTFLLLPSGMLLIGADGVVLTASGGSGVWMLAVLVGAVLLLAAGFIGSRARRPQR